MDDNSQTQQRFTWRLSCLLAVIPVLLAFFGTTRVPEGIPLAGERETDSLVFYQHAVNLGEVPAVGTIPATFFFQNTSDKPIQITSLDPSCGCLAPKILRDKREYAPGEQGEFMVSVHTANEKPGPKSYSVAVNYDDGQPRTSTVRFRLQVPVRKVTIDPPEVFFYQLTGQPDSREIRIEDHRGTRLNVKNVEITSDQIDFKIGQAEETENGVWSTPISLDVPGQVRPGREIASLRVWTDDEEYKLIQIPILIQGRPGAIQQVSGEMQEQSRTESVTIDDPMLEIKRLEPAIPATEKTQTDPSPQPE